MSNDHIVYVCPDCGEWASELSNGHPSYSRCEELGHRRAFGQSFELVGEPFDPMPEVESGRPL